MPQIDTTALATALANAFATALGQDTAAPAAQAPSYGTPDRTPVRRGTTELQLTLDVAHDGAAIDAYRELEAFARENGDSPRDPATVVQWLLSLGEDVTPTAWRATDYPSYSGRSR